MKCLRAFGLPLCILLCMTFGNNDGASFDGGEDASLFGINRGVPLIQRATSFSDLVFRNKILKRPSQTLHGQLFHKNEDDQSKYQSHSQNRKPRIIYIPIIESPKTTTSKPVNPKDSLNIDKPGSPYGLIHKLFPVETNEIAVTNLEEIPEDLDPDEVWLSDGNLLVLKGGYSSSKKKSIVHKPSSLSTWKSTNSEDTSFKPSKRLYSYDTSGVISTLKNRRRISLRRRGYRNYEVI